MERLGLWIALLLCQGSGFKDVTREKVRTAGVNFGIVAYPK